MTRTQHVLKIVVTAVAALTLGLAAGCNDTGQAPGGGDQEQEREQEREQEGEREQDDEQNEGD